MTEIQNMDIANAEQAAAALIAQEADKLAKDIIPGEQKLSEEGVFIQSEEIIN